MRARRFARAAVWTMAAVAGGSAARAQTPPEGPPLRLADLQQAALAADPRGRQVQLHGQQAELRRQNIEAEWRPAISVVGLTQIQSDAPTSPIAVGGQPLFAAPKDTYDISVRVDQRILDPSNAPRLAVEHAQAAEAQARVRTALFTLKLEVNDAFFGALLLQQQDRALAAAITDLEGRLRETATRAREGAALGADAAAVEATLLQRRQEQADVLARRRTALTRLAELTGQPVSAGQELVVPDLGAAVTAARASLDRTRARPEYEQFQRTRERIDQQGQAVTADAKPRLSVFARAGYAKPGLDFISNTFEAYGLAGVQLQWKPVTWGSTGREREALALQQQIVAADEAAFTRGLQRTIAGDLDTIDRLDAALALDDQIVNLRESVERTTGTRFREGVVTAADYLDRTTELLGARVAQASHRVELAQAGARLLTTLGLEVR